MSLVAEVRNAIEMHALIEKGQRVLVGVSGGADSVALLYILHFLSQRLGFDLVVAHLHHGTRGDASDGDLRFVRELCWRLGVPCVGREVNVPALAKKSGRSLEMEAREVRHEFFAESCTARGADSVALAHTADDQAETFMLKLARGAGLRGLAGMNWNQPMHGMRVIRPMLNVSRAQIEQFLTHHRLIWREDASNADLRYKRNCVRHQVLPFLEEKLSPAMRQTLLRTMDVLRCEDEWMSEIAEGCLKKVSSVSGDILYGGPLALHPLAARRRVIMTWLHQNGVPSTVVNFDSVCRVDELLLSTAGSRSVQLTDQWRVMNQYGELRVMPLGCAGVQDCVLGLELTRVTARGFVADSARQIGEYPSCAAIDLEKLADRELVVRPLRDGDRMRPLGMRGTRKLQDILVDLKIPQEQRSRVAVVVCAGEIVWVPGYRISEDWKVCGSQSLALHLNLSLVYAKPMAKG